MLTKQERKNTYTTKKTNMVFKVFKAAVMRI